MVELSAYDPSDMKSVLDSMERQCREAMHLGSTISVQPPIRAVVIAGMGGSALPGDFLSCYLRDCPLPIVVARDYQLPAWVTRNTLVFIVSYSGNTEETVAMLADAKRRGCKIILISSGGKLRDAAREEKILWIQLPQGVQPRDATGFMMMPILGVLERSGIVLMHEEVDSMLEALRKDHARQGAAIAQKLVGKISVIYASQQMECIARAWKVKINENAKVPAFCGAFPEMNHNEMVGFTNPQAAYYFIFIEDLEDGLRVKRRMMITKKLLEERGLPVLMIRLAGKSRLARLFSALLLGSYVGYYLALENKTDPTPVEMVEDFKSRLKEIRSGAFF